MELELSTKAATNKGIEPKITLVSKSLLWVNVTQYTEGSECLSDAADCNSTVKESDTQRIASSQLPASLDLLRSWLCAFGHYHVH